MVWVLFWNRAACCLIFIFAQLLHTAANPNSKFSCFIICIFNCCIIYDLYLSLFYDVEQCIRTSVNSSSIADKDAEEDYQKIKAKSYI